MAVVFSGTVKLESQVKIVWLILVLLFLKNRKFKAKFYSSLRVWMNDLLQSASEGPTQLPRRIQQRALARESFA